MLQNNRSVNLVAGVRTVLVVHSSVGMVFDSYALRHEISLAYPEAKVYFQTTDGKAVGEAAPSSVDLLIDFTPPGAKEGFFRARKLRSKAKFAVGRYAGSRKKIYNKTFDEKAHGAATEVLKRERQIQREVLALAGIEMAVQGFVPADRGKTIALELPPFQKL